MNAFSISTVPKLYLNKNIPSTMSYDAIGSQFLILCLAKNECSQVKYMVDTPRYFEALETHLLYIPICPCSKQFAFVKF